MEWTGARTPKGDGLFAGGSKRDRSRSIRKAHRVAWVLQRGPIPPAHCVLHRCDNPGCVRGSHLFLGTVADNNRDMFAKGRARPRRFGAADRAKALRALAARSNPRIEAAREAVES